MAETTSNLNISDIPEDLRPLRRLGLTAAMIRAFDPRFLAAQLGANFGSPGTSGGVAPATGSGTPDISNATANGVRQGTTSSSAISPAAIAQLAQQLLGENMSGKSGNPNNGQIAPVSGAAASALSSKDISLNNAGLPITGATGFPYNPNQVVGGGVGPVTTVGSPAPSGTYNPYTFNPTAGIPGIPSSTPGATPTGGIGSTPNPAAGMTPQQIAALNAQMGILPGPVGQTGSMDPGGGYNPNHYASDGIAQQIASGLGGSVSHTSTEGPNAPPPQNLINLGIPGGGNMLNAGLVNQLLTDPGQAPFRDARLNAEIAYLRHESPSSQSFSGPPRTSWAQPGDDAVRAMLSRGVGNMPGYKAGGKIDAMRERLRVKRYSLGGDVQIPGIGNFGNALPLQSGSGTNQRLDANGNAVSPRSAEEIARERSLYGGDTMSSAQNVENSNIPGIPGGGGGGGGQQATPNPTGPSTVGNVSDNPSYPYAPYVPYSGQRVLDFRDIPGQGNLPTSTNTRNYESGVGRIPSLFDENGQINAGRDPVTGQATSNLGIANDQMDWAGRSVGDAIEGYRDLAGRSGNLASTYSPYETSDPRLLSAGQIHVDPLNQYQMSGPGMVRASSVDPSGRWIDPGMTNAYMDPYRRAVTDATRTRAIDDFNEQKGARNSSFVGRGSFGGSRQAIQEGLAGRALNRQLQSIDATGNEAAYNNGQAQYNVDRASGMAGGQFNATQNLQAQLANQGATQATNRSNLDALLQTQGLATQAGLTAAQSNQGANVTQAGQLLTAQQQAEQQRNQNGQAAARLNLDAAQIGGNLTNTALQGMTNASGQLSSIGATRADLQRLAQQMEQSRLQSLQQAGTAQDARSQGALDYGYQTFINQQNHPYQLANFWSGQLSGVPIGVNQEQVQFQNVSPWSQIGGLATAGIGALGSYYQNQNRSNGN